MTKVKTITECDYDGRLERTVERLLSSGWEILAGPTLAYHGEPSGVNGHVVGYKWPHFLIIFIKRGAPQ